MKAKKENKVYTINSEQEKQRYLKDGYDIYDDAGNIAEYSPKKKISFSEYMSAVREIEGLRAIVAELKEKEESDEKPEKEPEKKAGTKKAGD